ncbi:hypothetical protein ACXIUS_02205 [Bosea thiooxidans]|nr:hypothetical protein [Bosea sp. (in: a-proteobacteria)]
MSDARSLTPLSQADYDAIEAAVMETSRGRWFMTEYAKRNRQADTLQLLTAIGRIERVVGLGVQETSRDTSLIEAAALISDLRVDLERISGKTQERSSGLAAQIERAAGSILGATESIQEVAWNLRESGADTALCDRLDRHTAEASQAVGLVDSVVQRIDKIADTIAMLDSSLRAFGEITRDPSPHYLTATELAGLAPRTTPPLSSGLAADTFGNPVAPPADEPPPAHQLNDLPNADPRIGTIELLDDDIVFSEPILPATAQAAPSSSETGLREIDALSAERKLAFFA